MSLLLLHIISPSLEEGKFYCKSVITYIFINTNYCYYSFSCRGRSFLHVRMQENIEVNNPMYIQDDIDDEDINLDRSFPLQEKVI